MKIFLRRNAIITASVISDARQDRLSVNILIELTFSSYPHRASLIGLSSTIVDGDSQCLQKLILDA